jgi:hypothetical protein
VCGWMLGWVNGCEDDWLGGCVCIYKWTDGLESLMAVWVGGWLRIGMDLLLCCS